MLDKEGKKGQGDIEGEEDGEWEEQQCRNPSACVQPLSHHAVQRAASLSLFKASVCYWRSVCASSQMSLNRNPSALCIPAATGEHLTSSRLLLERCQIKGVCVCVGLCVQALVCVSEALFRALSN